VKDFLVKRYLPRDGNAAPYNVPNEEKVPALSSAEAPA